MPHMPLPDLRHRPLAPILPEPLRQPANRNHLLPAAPMTAINRRLKEPQNLLPHPEELAQEFLAHGAYAWVFEAIGDVAEEREAAAEARFVVVVWEAEEGCEVRVHFGHEADVVDIVAVLEGAAEGCWGVDVEEWEVGGCHVFCGDGVELYRLCVVEF